MVWPLPLVRRWADVAHGGFRLVPFSDVPHSKLMCHPSVVASVFGELAIATAKRIGVH